MSFTVTYDPDREIIETIFFGKVTADDAQREIFDSHQLAVEKDCCLFFADLSKAELQLSVIDVFKMPQIFKNMGWDRRVRVAQIPPLSFEGQQMAEFYETVTMNRGWIVKTFFDKRQALQWLKGAPD